eukprot:148144_1
MPRVLPDWVEESSKKYEKQIQQNLINAAKARKQKKQNRTQLKRHRAQLEQSPNNTNTNNRPPHKRHKPSTPPPVDRPDATIPDVPSEPAPKPKPKPKPKTTPTKKKKKTPTKKKKKSPTKKRKKKRKNRNNLMLDTDEDEWSDASGGSLGSLVDFVIQDVGSDEEYDPAADLSIHKRDRKRYRNYNSDGDLISDEDDISESFGSLMSLNDNYNSMILSSPPKKKRKGIRTVCNILPLCQWGAKCYRKNKQHFEQYAHPWKDKIQ